MLISHLEMIVMVELSDVSLSNTSISSFAHFEKISIDIIQSDTIESFLHISDQINNISLVESTKGDKMIILKTGLYGDSSLYSILSSRLHNRGYTFERLLINFFHIFLERHHLFPWKPAVAFLLGYLHINLRFMGILYVKM